LDPCASMSWQGFASLDLHFPTLKSGVEMFHCKILRTLLDKHVDFLTAVSVY
jgi:hypothetical protein